jgi:hypothetical protein
LISFWLNSECLGPAQTLTLSDGLMPNYLTEWDSEYAENRCGRLHATLSSSCCKSNLESNFSFTTLNFEDDSKLEFSESIMPKSSNGFNYCYIDDTDKRWILDDSQCSFDNFKCTGNTLLTFPNSDCQGVPSRLNLPNSLLNASIQTVEGATTKIEFIGYYPSELLTPDKTLYSSLLSRTFYGSALVGTVIVFTFYLIRYSKGRTIYMLMYLISQCAWLGWILLDYMVTFHTFAGDERMTLSDLRYFWFGVCTFLNVTITANILLVFTQRSSRRNQVIATALLFALQMFLAGELYLGGILPHNDFTTTWKRMVPGWVLFFYFFDIAPPVFIFWSLLSSYHFKDYKVFILILVLLQTVNAMWYISVFVISTFTTLLYTDKSILAANGPIAFSHVFHSIVSCVLNHQMRAILGIVATRGSNRNRVTYQSFEFGSKEFDLPPRAALNYAQNLDLSTDHLPVANLSYDIDSSPIFMDSTDSDDNQSYFDYYYHAKPYDAAAMSSGGGSVQFKMGGGSVRSSGTAETILIESS